MPELRIRLRDDGRAGRAVHDVSCLVEGVMRGRKPLPTVEKVARGNPGKRPLNRDEPKSDPCLPECPPHLNDEAKLEWARMGAQLRDEGRIALVHKAIFASYCQAWGRWVEAETMLKQYGIIVKGKDNRLERSPYLRVANEAMGQMMKAVAELGITPSSQTRIVVTKPTPKATEREGFKYLQALQGAKASG